MHIDRLVLFGAGGHAKVVIDAFLAGGGKPEQLSVLDGDPALHGARILGIEIAPLAVGPELAGATCHVAIGNAGIRERISREILAAGGHLATIVHPAAILSPDARVGAGAFIAAGAVIAPASGIGEGGIVNHRAVVDHDCVVGAFSHIAPGTVLGGGVAVGDRTLVGAGAVVLPGRRIGCDAVIGAGAIVTRSVGDDEKVVILPVSKFV